MSRTYGKYVIPVLFIVALILAYFVLKPFIIPLLMSAVVAYIFYPVYKWVKKGVKNETLSATLVSLLIIALITLPVLFVINALSRDAYALYLTARDFFLVGDFLETCTLQMCVAARDFLSGNQVQLYIQQGLQTATTFVIQTASNFVVAIPHRIIEVFVTFFATFYLLRDGDKLTAKIKKLVVARKGKKQHIFKRFDEVMYAVLFGALLVAFIQGILGAIGFYLFGVSSPLLWGVVMFFLALIPFVGTGLVWVPAALFLLIEGIAQSDNGGIFRGIGLFVYGVLIISSIDNIIKPKIIGGRARVHPILVLVGTFGGLALMGLPGIVVGPVILAMSVTFLDLYVMGE
jgi:predicted PurR-regulated permease PerM